MQIKDYLYQKDLCDPFSTKDLGSITKDGGIWKVWEMLSFICLMLKRNIAINIVKKKMITWLSKALENMYKILLTTNKVFCCVILCWRCDLYCQLSQNSLQEPMISLGAALSIGCIWHNHLKMKKRNLKILSSFDGN